METCVRALEADGYRLWPTLIDFLREYSGLEFDLGYERKLRIDPSGAVDEIFIESTRRYESLVETALAPVGMQSHLTIFLSPEGVFYGGYDHVFGPLGADFLEMLDGFLPKHPRPLKEWEELRPLS